MDVVTPPSVVPAVETRGSANHRRAPRSKVFLLTEVVIDAVTARAHVLDVSTTGSKVHTATDPQCGSEASVRLNGEPKAGKVVWVNAGRFGLEFATELAPDQMAAIVRA
ncbi:PilZ domain-containing protein [Sphingomonas oligophenolica]|uniref:PilZ domain-containing protein n=1 Tax=Sphingomonas oligophenolica TaxID=301154 RepID=A0A502CHA2_9SPHN|nr:PilZ domain-containing protein [Sphingomonas oligophenolica]TPG12348.1 PilZ domain-containing protein [Sphingomonas oligophenolica]